MLEKKIEKAVCDYAESLGCYQRKFSSPAYASVPDRVFGTPIGLVFWIEFKAKGKKATEKQAREHERMRAARLIVFVVDDIQQGKQIIDQMVAVRCP